MKLTSTMACLSATAVMTLGVVGPALAEPSKAIQLSWDGGSAYSDTTTESFVGFPVAVPGDSTERTLMVRNDGPTDGTLHVSITNVDILDPTADDVHHNPNHTAPDDSGRYAGAGDQGDFYSDLLIDWNSGSSSIKELDAAGDTQVLTIDLPRGETTPVTIGYELPIDSTSGNKANVEPRLGKFDVVLSLGGDTEDGEGTEEVNAGADADHTADADNNTGADNTADAEAGDGTEADSTGDSDGSDGSDGGEASDPSQDGPDDSRGIAHADTSINTDADSAAEAGGSLPRTGGVMWWTAALGALLAGSGAAIAAATRKKS